MYLFEIKYSLIFNNTKPVAVSKDLRVSTKNVVANTAEKAINLLREKVVKEDTRDVNDVFVEAVNIKSPVYIIQEK